MVPSLETKPQLNSAGKDQDPVKSVIAMCLRVESRMLLKILVICWVLEGQENAISIDPLQPSLNWLTLKIVVTKEDRSQSNK